MLTIHGVVDHPHSRRLDPEAIDRYFLPCLVRGHCSGSSESMRLRDEMEPSLSGRPISLSSRGPHHWKGVKVCPLHRGSLVVRCEGLFNSIETQQHCG